MYGVTIRKEEQSLEDWLSRKMPQFLAMFLLRYLFDYIR